MRLLHVNTLTFTVFRADPPQYAIASHRWLEGHEASFQDVADRQNVNSLGHKKIESFAQFIRENSPHIEWIWIDTCCINKTDAQEITEAINSMFRWYNNAAVCLAYLKDVPTSTDLGAFEQSEWFRRGWTLQELLAPKLVIFLASTWQVIGNKGTYAVENSGMSLETGPSLIDLIARRTKIPSDILSDYRHSHRLPRKEKMMWMADRITTREEDMSYCLFGILDVAMVANYGEGKDKAQRRLREAMASDNPAYHAFIAALQDVPATQAMPSTTVPFPPDLDFIERGNLLDDVSERLSRPAARVALVGLGGVGKSQLAIEYSYRYRKAYPAAWVLWIHASNAARFSQSVQNFLSLAKIRWTQASTTDMFQALRTWLWDRSNGQWLVILDNADDVDFLLGNDPQSTAQSLSFLETFPSCEHGSLMITSRNRIAAERLVDYNDIIEIPPMDGETALALLNRKLGQQTAESDQNIRNELAVTLEFMPLAMTQAVAFLRRRGRRYSMRRYLDDLRDINESKQSLLDEDNGDLRRDKEAANSIILTWQISFEYILSVRKTAADLLSLMCLCDRQAIPEVLVNDNTASKECFEEDLEVLSGFSFIATVDGDSSTFQMHRLVQLATRRWLRARGHTNMHLHRLIEKLSATFLPDHRNWRSCDRLFPHVFSLANTTPQEPLKVLRWATVITNGAFHACYRKEPLLLHQAVHMMERCHNITKVVLGTEHVASNLSMCLLAICYGELGQHTKAAEIAESCWDLHCMLSDEEQPDTLKMSYLLAIYGVSRKRVQDRETEERWLEKTKNTLGEDHPDTLELMQQLAWYYGELGDSAKAVEISEQCWERRKRTLGEGHPHTLRTMHDLALYRSELGDNAEAAKISEQCWEQRKRTFGEDHPHTLRTMHDLALYRSELGDNAEAAKIGEQCWEQRKRTLGEDHPDTLQSLHDLASFYGTLGDNTKAAEMYRECGEARKKGLGEGHPDTMNTFDMLSTCRAMIEGEVDPEASIRSSECSDKSEESNSGPQSGRKKRRKR